MVNWNELAPHCVAKAVRGSYIYGRDPGVNLARMVCRAFPGVCLAPRPCLS